MTTDEQQAQRAFEQANPPDMPPEPPPPEPEAPPPSATVSEPVTSEPEAPPSVGSGEPEYVPPETIYEPSPEAIAQEQELANLPEAPPAPAPTPPDLSQPAPLAVDTSVIDLPSDYEFSSEPYDQIVKMALEGATVPELLAYLQEHPDADRGAYAGRLLAPIQQKVQDAYNLSGVEQFDAFRQLGLIPMDAKYTDIGSGKWGYTVPSVQTQYQMPADFKVGRTEMAYIRNNYPEIYKAVQQDLGTAFASYGDRIVLAQWEAGFQKRDPQMFEVYRNAGGGQAGVDAVNAEVVRLNTIVEQQNLLAQSGRGGHEVNTLLDGYETSGGGYDIAKFLRENPDTGISALQVSGFADMDIQQAQDYNAQSWRRATAQDRLYLEAYKIGLDQTGQQSPEDQMKALAKNPDFLLLPSTEPKIIGLKPDMSERAFVANFVEARVGQPEYSSLGNKSTVTAILKDLATREYMRLYGKGTALASQGTDVLTVIAPAAKALHPEYTIRDVTGAEWALSTANIALLVIAPVLGKVAGTGIKVISGVKTVVETGAALTYPMVTAVQWKNMSTPERILSIVVDTTIAGAVLGKSVLQGIKQLSPGIGFEKRVEALAKASRSGDATKVWVAGDRLEAYGKALEKAGVRTGTRIAEQGKFIKGNAYGIARSSSAGISKLDPVISDLRAIDSEMGLLRQRGSLAIDPKTGKIYDTETGEEMTLARQVERLRTAKEVRIGTMPITRAEAEVLGLTDDELTAIMKEAGGDRELFLKLAREKAAQNAKNADFWNKMLEDSAKKYEAKETPDGEPITPEEEAAIRWSEEGADLQDTLRQVREMNAQREKLRQAAITEAAREVSRERVYRTLFPERTATVVTTIRTVGAESVEQAAIPEQQGIPGLAPVQPLPLPAIKPVTREIQAPLAIPVATPITIMAPKIKEQTETRTAAYPYTGTETETKTKTKVVPLTETQTKTQIQPQTATQTKTETQTQTETQTELQTITEPKVAEQTVTETKTETGKGEGGGEGEGGGTGTGGGGGGDGKDTGGGVRLLIGDIRRKRIPVPAGSIAWRMGMFWKYIPAPWNESKPRTSAYVPQGAKMSGRTPQETLQVVGKRPAVIPKSFSVDLGVVDAFITNYGKTITFTGHGTSTDVGSRIASPTTGMSVDVDSGGYLDNEPVASGVVKRSGRISKRPLKRKSKRLSNYDRMTTLKGFRVT